MEGPQLFGRVSASDSRSPDAAERRKNPLLDEAEGLIVGVYNEVVGVGEAKDRSEQKDLLANGAEKLVAKLQPFIDKTAEYIASLGKNYTGLDMGMGRDAHYFGSVGAVFATTDFLYYLGSLYINLHKDVKGELKNDKGYFQFMRNVQGAVEAKVPETPLEQSIRNLTIDPVPSNKQGDLASVRNALYNEQVGRDAGATNFSLGGSPLAFRQEFLLERYSTFTTREYMNRFKPDTAYIIGIDGPNLVCLVFAVEGGSLVHKEIKVGVPWLLDYHEQSPKSGKRVTADVKNAIPRDGGNARNLGIRKFALLRNP